MRIESMSKCRRMHRSHWQLRVPLHEGIHGQPLPNQGECQGVPNRMTDGNWPERFDSRCSRQGNGKPFTLHSDELDYLQYKVLERDYYYLINIEKRF